MITLAQINAQSNATALTEEEQLVLINLVKRSPAYRSSALFNSFPALLNTEVETPTVKTKFLRAVITALGLIPSIVVESEGDSDSTSFFSTKVNWEDLALDVLALFYGVELLNINPRFLVVQRRIENLVIEGESAPVNILI